MERDPKGVSFPTSGDVERVVRALADLIAAVDWAVDCGGETMILKADNTNIIATNERARAALAALRVAPPHES